MGSRINMLNFYKNSIKKRNEKTEMQSNKSTWEDRGSKRKK
jgi:hypothetical protein